MKRKKGKSEGDEIQFFQREMSRCNSIKLNGREVGGGGELRLACREEKSRQWLPILTN